MVEGAYLVVPVFFFAKSATNFHLFFSNSTLSNSAGVVYFTTNTPVTSVSLISGQLISYKQLRIGILDALASSVVTMTSLFGMYLRFFPTMLLLRFFCSKSSNSKKRKCPVRQYHIYNMQCT